MSDLVWLKHRGGPRPVDPETRVIVRHRSGEVSTRYINDKPYCGNNHAAAWGWMHNGDPGDIVEYVIEPSLPADTSEGRDQ